MYILHYLKSLYFSLKISHLFNLISLPGCIIPQLIKFVMFFHDLSPNTVVIDILQDFYYSSLMGKPKHYILCEVSPACP